MNPFAETFLKNLEQHADSISRYDILKIDLMTTSRIFFPRRKMLDSRRSASVNNAFLFGLDLGFSKNLEYGNLPS